MKKNQKITNKNYRKYKLKDKKNILKKNKTYQPFFKILTYNNTQKSLRYFIFYNSLYIYKKYI